MHEIFQDTSLDDESKARILYYALEFIHPFSDGNGRTGRLLYTVISNGYNIEDENVSHILKNTE